jgi:hypothetical protein
MKTFTLCILFILTLPKAQSAENKRATIEAHCYSFFMSPLDLNNGDSAFFTTYDGLSRRPYISSSGAVSGEVKPKSNALNLYAADYIASDNNGIYSYGVFDITLPSTDINNNGVLDFLEKKQSVNAIVNVKETTQWDKNGLYTNDEFTCLFTRDANDPNGTYILKTLNGADASSLKISGDWYTSSWNGTIEYQDGGEKLSLQASQPRIAGGTVNIIGQSNFEYESLEERLNLSNLSFSDGIDTVNARFISLKKVANSFVGEMNLVDGESDTSWVDFANWKIFINDFDYSQDSEKPRITDSSNSINLNGWGWNKWPWVFNNEHKTWLYHYPSGVGQYSVYHNNEEVWYLWSETDKKWVKRK